MRALCLMAMLVVLCACRSEEERVASACRLSIRWHLVDPGSAEFTTRAVHRTADGWEARLTVGGTDADGRRHSSSVTCRTDLDFEVVDLSD